MTVTKIPQKSDKKDEPSLKQKYETLLHENHILKEKIGDIWWLLTDLRDNYSAEIGPRSYVTAAIALAEPIVDDEL